MAPNPANKRMVIDLMSCAADLLRTFVFNDSYFRAGDEIKDEPLRVNTEPSSANEAGQGLYQATINRLAHSDRNQKLTRAVNCTFLGSETVEVGTPKDESVGFVSGIANW